MLQKMEVTNAIFHYELKQLWDHFVSIMKRRRWQIPLLWHTSFYCQENSELWYHEKACFLKKKFLVGKYAGNERFRKMLSIKQFRFLYILQDCQSYAMRWSKLWNELVRCGIWGRQMPQVSVSYATSEGLRWYKWQFRVWKMRKMEWKNGFLTPFSFLDWTEKSTKICRVFSAGKLLYVAHD